MNTIKYIRFCIDRLFSGGGIYKNLEGGKLPVCYKQFISEEYQYKRWYELQREEKKAFIKDFVHNYQQQYPDSKTNISLKELVRDKNEYRDSPCVFGIFYEDIWKIKRYEEFKSTRNKRFKHPSFQNLLVKR